MWKPDEGTPDWVLAAYWHLAAQSPQPDKAGALSVQEWDRMRTCLAVLEALATERFPPVNAAQRIFVRAVMGDVDVECPLAALFLRWRDQWHSRKDLNPALRTEVREARPGRRNKPRDRQKRRATDGASNSGTSAADFGDADFLPDGKQADYEELEQAAIESDALDEGDDMLQAAEDGVWPDQEEDNPEPVAGNDYAQEGEEDRE